MDGGRLDKRGEIAERPTLGGNVKCGLYQAPVACYTVDMNSAT